MNEQPLRWAHEVGDLLDELDLAWALAGALAAIEYRSDMRVTGDADLLTTWHPDLVERLHGAGYDIDVKSQPGEEQPHHLRLHRGVSTVDLLISTTDYQIEAIRRAGDEHLLTIEDVLIHKVLADRARDRGDVASILATDPELDEEYLDSWMEAWDITDRWRAARDRGPG